MKIFTILYVSLCLFTSTINSQNWYPAGFVPPATRYDDIYFVNSQLGWTVNSSGHIYKTTDSGNNWTLQYVGPFYFRSVEFLDNQTGFAGTLDSVLLRTINGGQTWEEIQDSIPTPIPGICGLSHVGDNVYGVGIWSYPAYFIKSQDRGVTWTYTDMSAYADGLVECYFLDENIGFVTGIQQGPGAVILKTTDGGDTWQNVFATTGGMQYVWKLDFRNSSLAYGSIESFGQATRIVKTTDGGDTWEAFLVTLQELDIQGIGFITDDKGWVGSRNFGLYETIDGGLNWYPLNTVPNVNRIVKLTDDLMLASASEIYKYDNSITSTQQGNVPTYAHEIIDVVPNPFDEKLNIKIRIDASTYARVDLLSIDGKHMASIANERLNPGVYNFQVSNKISAGLQNGIYLVLLRTNEGFMTKKVVKSDND